jgi:hypothetical protein
VRVSIHEDKAFQMGKSRVDVAGLKTQLARLKEDLSRFVARSPHGSVVGPLRQRIHEIEMQIAEADRERLRNRPPAAAAGEEGGESGSVSATGSRFPPRRR